MVDLYATPAAAAALPLKIGTVSIVEVQASLFLIAPYKGKLKQAASILNIQMGLLWPVAHELILAGGGGGYVFWFDHSHIALLGVEPSTKLPRYAAVTDVSDAWCIVDISGVSVRDILARVTPLDMRPKSFKSGITQRSMIMQMHASITCLGQSRFRLMVFRSMARTLVHDLTIAMESVAARVNKV